MRTARFTDGTKRFDFRTYLRPQQIKAQFSKMAAALKYGTNDPSIVQCEEVSVETSQILDQEATSVLLDKINDQPQESDITICPMEVHTVVYISPSFVPFLKTGVYHFSKLVNKSSLQQFSLYYSILKNCTCIPLFRTSR